MVGGKDRLMERIFGIVVSKGHMGLGIQQSVWSPKKNYRIGRMWRLSFIQLPLRTNITPDHSVGSPGVRLMNTPWGHAYLRLELFYLSVLLMGRLKTGLCIQFH